MNISTMRQNRRRVAILAGLLAATIAVGTAAQQSTGTPARIRQQQRDAYRSGGLRAAAAVTGFYVSQMPTGDWGGPTSLENLAELSSVVAVGTPVSNEAAATADGRYIHTFFRVRLTNIMKGDAQPGREVTIIVPGGRVSFEGGSWAQLNSPGYRKPDPRRPHVWFLKPAPAGLLQGHEPLVGDTRAYVPMFGPLGVYALGGDKDPVMPNGRFETEFAKSLVREQLPAKAFIARVQAAVAVR